MKHTDEKNTIISEKSLAKTADYFGSVSKVVVSFWAVLGVVAGLISVVVLYNTRPLFEANNVMNMRVDAVEEQDKKIEQKIDRIDAKIDQRFDNLDSKIESYLLTK